MLDINVKQNKRIGILFAVVGGIASMLAIVVYLQRLRHAKEEKQIRALDREIKKLQLQNLKKQNGIEQ
jgi:TolA-binding protein